MAKTSITSTQLYAALVKAGVLRETDHVRRVTISTSSYDPFVEIDVEYMADEGVIEAIESMKFDPNEINDRRLCDPA